MSLRDAALDDLTLKHKALMGLKEKMREVETFHYLDNAKSKWVQHQKREYEIRGHRFKTVEALENFCINEGIDSNSLKTCPQIIPQGGGDADIVVKLKEDI